MRRAVLVLSLALVAVALAPSATAHGEHGYEQGKLVDNLYVSFGLEAALPMANTPTQIVVSVSDVNKPGDTGVKDVDVTLFDPSNETIELSPYFSQGTFVSNATFHADGPWRANVTLHPLNVSAEFTFPVYAEGPYVWDSPNAATGLFAVGVESDVQFRITEWRTQDRAPAPWDVTVRLEHWTDDHSTMLSSTIVETEPTAPGLVSMKHAFNASGMYHAYIGSPTLGLAYDDRPYVHVYALACEEALQYDPEHACGAKKASTPGAGALAGLAALAAVALGVARRRR